MIRRIVHLTSVAFLIMASAGALLAQPAEVTLKGNIVCAHCLLGEGAKCQNAIQVQEKEKLVTYYLLDKGKGESYHRAVCGGSAKAGTVTGVVSEKDGKKWITPKKVEYAQQTSAPRVNWLESYGAARKQAIQEGKPLAVVVGSGEGGWSKLAREGAWTADAEKVLSDSYVPVYLDTATSSGKALADELGIKGMGLVISNRTCDFQAHSQQGQMPCADLAVCLRKFSGAPVMNTNAGGHAHHVVGSSPASGGAPAVASPYPVATQGGGGATCPNCRK